MPMIYVTQNYEKVISLRKKKFSFLSRYIGCALYMHPHVNRTTVGLRAIGIPCATSDRIRSVIQVGLR